MAVKISVAKKVLMGIFVNYFLDFLENQPARNKKLRIVVRADVLWCLLIQRRARNPYKTGLYRMKSALTNHLTNHLTNQLCGRLA